MEPEDNATAMAYRPLSEEGRFKIVAEKFRQVRAELLHGLATERARCRDLEARLEEAKEAERYATQALQRSLVAAKDYVLLDNIAIRLREDNQKFKDEIQELKDRASVDANVAEARVAAWERNSRELQRSLEQERQAARDAAREARDAAEKDKNALQDAFQTKEDEARQKHEDALTALRAELRSVREQCAEEVNVAVVEFEERAAQLTERASTLESDKLSLCEELSAIQGHVEYLQSRLAELQHAHVAVENEKSRLLESNRNLMLQQQNLLAAVAVQAAVKPPRATPAASRVQYSLPAPRTARTAPPAPLPGPYPQLSMAWRRGASVATNKEQAPRCSVAPSPPTQEPRRPRRQAFEAVDVVFDAVPASSAWPRSAKGRPAALQPRASGVATRSGGFTFKQRMFATTTKLPAAPRETHVALPGVNIEAPPAKPPSVSKDAVKEPTAVTKEPVKEPTAVTKEPVNGPTAVTKEPVKGPTAVTKEPVNGPTAVTKEPAKERPKGSRRLFSASAAPPSFLQFLSKLPASKMRFTVPAEKAAAPPPPPPPPPKEPEVGPSRDDTRQFFERQVQFQAEKKGQEDAPQSSAAGHAEPVVKAATEVAVPIQEQAPLVEGQASPPAVAIQELALPLDVPAMPPTEEPLVAPETVLEDTTDHPREQPEGTAEAQPGASPPPPAAPAAPESQLAQLQVDVSVNTDLSLSSMRLGGADSVSAVLPEAPVAEVAVEGQAEHSEPPQQDLAVVGAEQEQADGAAGADAELSSQVAQIVLRDESPGSDDFQYQLLPTPPPRCASLTCGPPEDDFPGSPCSFDAAQQLLSPMASPWLSPPPAGQDSALEDTQQGANVVSADGDGFEAISYSPLSSSTDDASPGALVIDMSAESPGSPEHTTALQDDAGAMAATGLVFLRECYEIGCSQQLCSVPNNGAGRPQPATLGSNPPGVVVTPGDKASMKRCALLTPTPPRAPDSTPRRLNFRDKKRRRLFGGNTAGPKP